MSNVALTTFAGGELTPKLDCRNEIEKYQSGCRRLEDMVPEVYGCATRRAGTRWYLEQYDTTQTAIREVSFIYNSITSYPLEFGHEYIRTFVEIVDGDDEVTYKGDKVIDVISVIETPYQAEDLPYLHIRQLNDVMWITHPDYAPRKLIRTDDFPTFELSEIEFTKGPFLTRNDLINPNVTDTAYMVIATSSPISQTQYTDNTSFYGTNWRGQTFTAPYRINLTSVTLRMFRTGSPGTVTVSIQQATTNDPATAKAQTDFTTPSSYDLAYGTKNGDTLTTDSDGENVVIALSSTVTLNAGVMYAIVIRAPSGDSDNKAHLLFTVDVYEGGSALNRPVGAGTWLITNQVEYYFNITGQAVISGLVYATGTMVCQDSDDAAISYFEEGHIGSLFKLTFPRTVTKLEGTGTNTDPITDADDGHSSINVKGSANFNTHGNWSATLVLQRRENSSKDEDWEDYRTYVSEIVNGAGSRNIQFAFTEDADNVEYRIVPTSYTSGTIRADITVQNSTEDVIVQILAINSTSEAEIAILSGTVIADPTRRWTEGAWSELRGYPKTVSFYEGRCVYGGNKALQPQVTPDYVMGQDFPVLSTVWLSQSDDFEDFENDIKDGDSFEVPIKSTEEIMWVEGLEKLFVGTAADEWIIQSNKLDSFLTPLNTTCKKHSSYGSNFVQPLNLESALLFVDATGRNIRQITYEETNSKENLTIFAEHITESGIVWLAFQGGTENIVWCGLDDGSLISMTYESDQKVIAWSKHPLQTDALALSGCCIPATEKDELWLAIQRPIDGSDVIYIEKMENDDYAAIEDCSYVDCGITYDDVSTSTITGLDHLEGETVSVLGDGVVLDDAVVESGSITTKLATVTTAVEKAQIGLPYTSLLQPMRITLPHPRGGSSLGSDTKVSKLMISLLDTGALQQSGDGETFYDVDLTNPFWTNSSEITGLFTGTIEVTADSSFDVNNPIVLRTSKPLPLTVRALIASVDVTS